MVLHRSGHSLQEPVVYGNKVKMNPDRDLPGEPSQVHIDSRLVECDHTPADLGRQRKDPDSSVAGPWG
jgi:hypothetical protein